MRKLSTTNLELAVWIGRLGSFTAAADRMHTTQPAVSARVKELEDMVGHQLFVRQGRGVELTPEGRVFVQKAETVLRQIDELSVSFSKAKLAGVVRLGSSSICVDLLAAMSVATARAMPLVTYQVELERAAPLLERLEARKLDLVIVSGPFPAHKFRAQSLGYDRMLWVTSPRVLEQRRHLDPAQRLAGLPIWCVHQDSFYFEPAVTGLRAQGANTERINATGNTMAVARVVAAGAGIGLVAESLVRGDLEGERLLPVPDLPKCETIEFSIVANADDSSAIVEEVMAAAVAASPFSRTPAEA